MRLGGTCMIIITLCFILLCLWCYYNRSILYHVIYQHHHTTTTTTIIKEDSKQQQQQQHNIILPNENYIINPYIISQYRLQMKSILLRYHTNEYIVRRTACIPSLLHYYNSSSSSTNSTISNDNNNINNNNGENGNNDSSSNSNMVTTTDPTINDHQIKNTNNKNNNNNNDNILLCMKNVLCLDTKTTTTTSVIDVIDTKTESSSSVSNTTTISWKFRLYSTVQEALNDLHNNILVQQQQVPTTTKDSGWISNMIVPSNWTLHPEILKMSSSSSFDHPCYTNIQYPFTPCAPPLVPHANPTAIYKCTIPSFPIEWYYKKDDEEGVTVQQDDTDTEDEYTILIHGIESAYYIYYNEQYIGFAKDSRTCSEFIIPNHCMKFIRPKHNNNNNSGSSNDAATNIQQEAEAIIYIVVVKWCDGTYVEDQDHWYLSGIHRSIEILRRPSKADIIDFQIQADANGHLECCVEYRNKKKKNCSSCRRVIIARLYNDQQLNADGTQWKEGQCIWEMEQSLLEDDDSSKSKPTSKLLFVDNIKNVHTWSAEIPNLYTLTISLYYEKVRMDDNNQETKELICTQSESCRIGFRTINIVSPGIIYINNKRIKNFAGMNRHEHDPDHGKVVSLQRMQQDICLLKQNNFNLVRTSHYPNHPSFYRLTDYYGLYVWDEANIEVHGMKPMGRLAHDPGWRATFLSRISRTVHRDRNHSSIIFWSMGNEAGRGRNLQEARDVIKILDPSRPVVYESGGALSEGTGRTELTDVISTMYPIIPRTKNLATRPDEDRPVILCEYSHSMGNSNGNLHYYWDAFWDDNLPRLQGGCIWDMIDQGIRVPGKPTNANMSSYFAYGGDFNDPIHDAQFCINGMFSPDREPHPAVHEIKFLQQPIQITPRQSIGTELLESAHGTTFLLNVSAMNINVSLSFHALNRHTFRDLSHLAWKWDLTSNQSSEVIRTGRFEVPIFGGRFEVYLNEVISRVRLLERANLENTRENVYWLNLIGSLKAPCSWANAGHVVARDQFRVAFKFEELLSPIKRKPKFKIQSVLDAMADDNCIEIIQIIGGTDKRHVLAKIDKQTGTLCQYAPNGRNFFHGEQGLAPNFVRAGTDNDKGGMELALNFMLIPTWAQSIWYTLYGYHDCSYASCWRSVGLEGDLPPRNICERIRVVDGTNAERVCVIALCTILAPTVDVALLKVKYNYTFHSDGRVEVSNHVLPLRSLQLVSSLPRVGMSMVLDPSLCQVQYYGRGPYENYPDRKASAQMGVYNTTPNEMSYYGYIVPSENGSRSDCEYASFCAKDGEGVCIVSTTSVATKVSPKDTFSFSASHHSIHELDAAKHTCDLEDRKTGEHPIYVNIDHAVMGLGGDTSWFPGVYDEFLVKPHHEYQYSLWLLPISKNDNIASIAWNR